MENTKTIGIWMDHSSADLIDLNAIKNNHSIKSNFSFSMKEEALSRSENIMNNKEQQMQGAFYKKIADELLNYDHVLLFGPTDAKKEFHNFLKKDLHFKDIKIDVESVDNMSDNEKKAYVENHFAE
jgi:stalled ribosome rescue protein Dom34